MRKKLFGKLNGRYSHGMNGTRPYRIWSSMITRCGNENHNSYKNYGLKGIFVCKEWLKFDNFWNDMKEGYSDNLTIDRIKNNKGYYKENCRWITKAEQSYNKSTSVLFEMNGKKQTVGQWINELKLKKPTVWARIQRGWSIKRALLLPVRKR